MCKLGLIAVDAGCCLAPLPKMPKQSLAPIETGVKGEQRHTLKRSGRIEPGRQKSLERTELQLAEVTGGLREWGSRVREVKIDGKVGRELVPVTPVWVC